MVNEPVDMIMPMLRELRSEMNEQFAEVRQRLTVVEDELKNVHRALLADTLMSRLVTSDFNGRISTLEADVQALMKGT